MKIKFKFCCYEKIVEYVEQTPKEMIDDDFNKWIDKIVKDAKWEYYV